MGAILGAALIAVSILLVTRRAPDSSQEPARVCDPPDLYSCGLSCGDVAPGALQTVPSVQPIGAGVTAIRPVSSIKNLPLWD